MKQQLSFLSNEIKLKKEQLGQTIQKSRASLTDEKIIEISVELDYLIYKYMQLKKDELK